MNFNLLLDKVLPVWNAITSFESAAFLLYLVILSLGTMLSYYCLPIGDAEQGSDGYLESLFKMFHLVFFADLDANELEGVHEIARKVDGGYRIEDGKWNR